MNIKNIRLNLSKRSFSRLREGVVILILILAVWTIVQAAPPSSPYVPGETLDPNCVPNSTSCTVGLTPGSVLFSGSNGLTSQDNSNLYWDNTNKRLGIGTNNPQARFDIWKPNTGNILSISNINLGDILTIDNEGRIGIGTTTPSEAMEFGLDKKMELSTNKTNLDDSGLIRLKWATNTGKPAIIWLDENNNRQAAIVTHDYLSYPDNRHQHFSIETSNSSGTLETRFQVPWGSDTVDIRTSDANFIVGGSHNFVVGSDGEPGTTILNSNTYITGTRKLGVGFASSTQSFTPGASMELYRNGSDVEFLINEASGTKESRLHLKRGTRDWEIINNADLAFEVEGEEVLRIVGGTTGRGNVGIGTTNPNSKLNVAGPIATAIANKTADYTLTDSDSTVTCDASSGAITITLPSASGIAGRIYTIKKIDDSSNAITIATSNSETIDGTSTYSLSAQWKYVSVQSNGTNWIIIANN